MNSAPWNATESDDDSASQGRPATLVSLHFIRFTLRRRWLACLMSALLGLLVAAAFVVAFPAVHDAKATLVLAHQPGEESSKAMATDESLLKTRTLAARVIENLGLTISPDDFLKTVTSEAVSSELLSVTLTASSNAEAVRRLEALTSSYLDFRGQQLSMQSNVYVSGIQERIRKLEGEVAALSLKIEQLSGRSSNASKLSDAVAQRASIQARIDTLQQEAEDVTLQTTSVVSSSRVIDPAATEAHAARRRVALALASGLIGGAALGFGAIMFFAITSDRLRRRSDVAAALELPVPVSIGRITPIPGRWLWVPHLRTLDGRRSDERRRLAHAIEMELPMPRRWGRIAVACIDNSDEVRYAASAAAAELARDGLSTMLIDLTERGSLVELASSDPGSHEAATLLRPRGIPTLAAGPGDLRVVGTDDDENLASQEPADVTLALADLDPSVGADHLTAWTDRVIIAVSAGRSSAERVRTAADLVRTAGLELRFAVLLRTERADESSGTAGFDPPVPVHLLDEHDQPYDAADSVDEEWDATSTPTITDQRQPAENDQITTLENNTAEQGLADQDHIYAQVQTSEEEVVDTLQPEVSEAHSPDELQPSTQPPAPEEAVVDTLQPEVSEAHSPDELQPSTQAPAPEEAVVDTLQPEVFEEHSPEEQEISKDQIATLDNEALDQDRPPDEQQALASHEQVGEAEPAADQEQPVTQFLGTEDVAYDNENLDDSHAEQHSAVTASDAEPGWVPEFDQMVRVHLENNDADGWLLYIDQFSIDPNSPVGTVPEPTPEDEELNWDWDWELDDLDSNQDLAVTAADQEAQNSDEHRSVSEIHPREEPQDGAERPTGNGEISNGQGRHKTRTRTRTRRTRGRSK